MFRRGQIYYLVSFDVFLWEPAKKMANNGAGGVGGVGGARVRSLIEKATNSTVGEVDPRLLKAIKSVVRYTDSEVPLVVETLMDNMKKPHSQVRTFYSRFNLIVC